MPTEALTYSFGRDALSPSLLTENLGLIPGVRIPDVEGMKDVFFASLNGRYVPFDPGSFGRWRPQRQAAAQLLRQSLPAESRGSGASPWDVEIVLKVCRGLPAPLRTASLAYGSKFGSSGPNSWALTEADEASGKWNQ